MGGGIWSQRRGRKKLSRDPEFRESVALLKFGVPFHIAFGLSLQDAVEFGPGERVAFLVVIGEMEGNKWDWDRMSWERRMCE